MQLGQSIVRFREHRGWTRAQLAANAGVHHDTLRRVEEGGVSLQVRTLVALARVLRVKVSEIVREAERLSSR